VRLAYNRFPVGATSAGAFAPGGAVYVPRSSGSGEDERLWPDFTGGTATSSLPRPVPSGTVGYQLHSTSSSSTRLGA